MLRGVWGVGIVFIVYFSAVSDRRGGIGVLCGVGWLALRAAEFGGFAARPPGRWCRVMRAQITGDKMVHVEYCTVACRWAGFMVHRVERGLQPRGPTVTRDQHSSFLRLGRENPCHYLSWSVPECCGSVTHSWPGSFSVRTVISLSVPVAHDAVCSQSLGYMGYTRIVSLLSKGVHVKPSRLWHSGRTSLVSDNLCKILQIDVLTDLSYVLYLSPHSCPQAHPQAQLHLPLYDVLPVKHNRPYCWSRACWHGKRPLSSVIRRQRYCHRR